MENEKYLRVEDQTGVVLNRLSMADHNPDSLPPEEGFSPEARAAFFLSECGGLIAFYKPQAGGAWWTQHNKNERPPVRFYPEGFSDDEVTTINFLYETICLKNTSDFLREIGGRK